jgi:predicted enzyme related to lactoylglutathione lyase
MTVDQSRPAVSMNTVVLDTDDLSGLATFYGELLGWKITTNEEDWITIRGDDAGVALAFQLAPNHRPPTWPSNDVPQQIHFDLHVDDLEEAARFAESLGARRVKDAGPNGTFIVFVDPSGHPFCLCID